MKNNKEKAGRIPRFRSEEEEAEFWARNSPEDFPDEFEPVRKEVELAGPVAEEIDRRAKKEMITLRLEKRMIRWAKELAKKKGKPYQVYLRDIIQKTIDGQRLARYLEGAEESGRAGEIRILRVPLEDGYSYLMPREDRSRLQKILAPAGLTVPETCSVSYDVYMDFGDRHGPFEDLVPAAFNMSPVLGVSCVVVDATTGKALSRMGKKGGRRTA